MNKKAHTFLLILSLLTVIAVPVFGVLSVQAQQSVGGPGDSSGTSVGGPGAGPGIFTLKSPLKAQSVGELIQDLIDLLSWAAVIVAVLALVWVGFQFILARGNTERMKELKNWLTYIVIGVAIVIGARVIITIVINTLAATGAVNERTLNSVNNVIKRK